jgi:hypothetical protein
MMFLKKLIMFTLPESLSTFSYKYSTIIMSISQISETLFIWQFLFSEGFGIKQVIISMLALGIGTFWIVCLW